MKGVLTLVFCALLFAGCSSEKDEPKITSFYENLNLWIAGDPEGAKNACALLTEAELQGSKEYARVVTDGDLCEAVLQENFSFLVRSDEYKLLSVDILGEPGKEKKVDSTLEVQNVTLEIETPDGQKSVPAKSAALVEGDKILNLAGMRLSTLAPEEFAQALGSDQSIPVDPLSAAYYSEKNK